MLRTRHGLAPFVLLISLIFAGCGGGGGGGSSNAGSGNGGNGNGNGGGNGDSPIIESYWLELEQSRITLGEGESTSVIINESYGTLKGESYNVESDHAAVTGQVLDGELVLSVKEVDRNELVTVTVTGFAGELEHTTAVVLDVVNTSALPIVAESLAILADRDRLQHLPEERLLYQFVSDVAFRTLGITATQQKSLEAQFDEDLIQSSKALNAPYSDLIETLAAYESRTTSEQALRASLTAVVRALNRHGELAIVHINNLVDNTRMIEMGRFQNGGFFVNHNTGLHSQFIGNTDLGGDYGDGFVFLGVYAYLNSLFNLNSICPVQL